MSFISKVERQKCWDSRDRYWDCLDTNGQEHERCLKLRQAYENSCPAQWVSVIVNKIYIGYTREFAVSGWLLYFSRYWNFIHNLCFIIPNNLLHAPKCVTCQWISCPFSLPHLVFPFHHCLSHTV